SLIVGGATVQQALTGLLPGTTYYYRVRASNAGGVSAASQTASFTTESVFVNTPPTLDPLPSLPVLAPDHGAVSVPLSGIGPGLGDDGQTLTVTALSSNPTVIPHPTVSYTSPNSTGTLTFVPTGVEGQALLTVTVDDGQAENNTVQRTLQVTVRQPPVLVDFADEQDFGREFDAQLLHGAVTFLPSGGIGFPPGGGLRYVAVNSSDNAMLALRSQAVAGNLPSSLATSIMVNLREIDDLPTGKHKGEIRLGISNEAGPVPSDPKKFFDDGGPTRRAVQVRLQAEHEEGKTNRQIKIRAGSHVGNQKTESPEITLAGEVELFEHWLRLSLVAVPVSTSQLEILYRLEDLGPDGLDAPSVVAEGSLQAINPDFIAAPWLHAGFVVTTEKGRLQHGLYLDQHTFQVLREAPAAPLALDPSGLTSQNLRARWQRQEGAIPLSYVVELSDSPTFASFYAADGSPGQTSGVTVTGPSVNHLQFTGLPPSTTFFYRIRAANNVGISPDSNLVTVTTFPSDFNAPPFFDPLPDLFLTPDMQQQVVPLTGISDGGELNQHLTFTVTSSNPAVIPTPTLTHLNPSSTGSLQFTPVDGATGSSVITVTVSDGAAQNHTFTRSFTVTVAAPNPLVTFSSPNDLAGYAVFTQEATLSQEPTAGASWPDLPDGQAVFARSLSPVEAVGVAFRPEAYDARSTGYFVHGIMFRATDLANVSPGQKDKFDLRLGFLSEPLPGANLKDTFNKSRPGLGVKLKMENQPGNPSKTLLLEAESYSVVPSGGGLSEAKGGKAAAVNVTELGQSWLRLVFQAVRRGTNQYDLSWALEDWGPQGQERVATLLTGPVFTATNGAFANDGHVVAGFQISGEASGSSPLFLDNHEVVANTRAPDAPAIFPAFAITREGFTLSWLASAIGRAVGGFVVEIVRKIDGFLSGLFLGVDGSPQAEGIVVNDPWEEQLQVTGLLPYTDYLWRVFATNADGTSLALAPVETRTLDFDFESWIAFHFDEDEQLDPDLSGPEADPDGDGIPNLLEFALGGHPRQPDSALTQTQLNANGQLLLTFKRRAGSTELLYIPEGTGDLHGSWSASGLVTQSVSAPDANGLETVVVRDTTNPDHHPRRFVRLRVEYLP
ncbi:MAG: hypothetical protein SNJ84_04850, partial [Verrucomicrobiia bacterium]